MKEALEFGVEAFTTGRSAIICLAAACDGLLEERIVSRLVGDFTENERKELFGSDVMTFSVKINLARGVGAIEKDLRTWLHLLRRARNACAHMHDDVFSDEAVAGFVEDAEQRIKSPAGKSDSYGVTRFAILMFQWFREAPEDKPLELPSPAWLDDAAKSLPFRDR